MMNSRAAFVTCILLCFFLTWISSKANAQQIQQERERVREPDGYFEITLKTPEALKLNVEELVRDRDLDPNSLYRVTTGGYLGFNETDWVDKIEFKVFDTPVTELPQYKRFSEILVDINTKAWEIKQMLARYDLLALRLMNICDRSRFPTLQSIDENIAQQLAIYDKLNMLRELVVNSLNKFMRERACRDQFTEYQKTLELYSRQLSELAKNFDRLSRRAIALSQELAKPIPEQSAPPAK